MADLQSIEELLESAERKQRSENQSKTPDQTRDTKPDHKFDHNADFVLLPKDASERSGTKREGDRYSPGGIKREHSRDRGSRALSEDRKSDRGSANGSVRSRRRSRSPSRDRARDRYRSRDDRSRDRGDYYRRGNDDGDRYYRPGGRSAVSDRRHDRRDRRDDRRDDRRNDRRDDRRREPRERRRTPPEPTDDERDRRTVFVQQLAARLRTKQLIEFFSQVGAVKEAQIVKDRVSNRSKGVGYVEFVNEESVDRALGLTGQQLLGIPIIAQLTEAEKNRQARNTEGVATLSNGIPFHRLYVGNIHFSIAEEDLRTVFEPFGQLEFCQLQKEEHGRSKGYGFVQFTEPDDAKNALESMNGFELAGRPIRVGLGNDKFTPETTQSLLQKFDPKADAKHQQQNQSAQGSSFSGMGGRGAHAGGTANFDRAGGKDADKTGGASALDDTDVAGVNFSNYSRDSLMRKLARTEDTEPKATPAIQQRAAPIDEPAPSRCILLKNMFTEEDAKNPGFDKELESDVTDECQRQYGKVLHCGVIPLSANGETYVKFETIDGGIQAYRGLNGRWFAGQRITAQYVVEAVYNMNFPNSAKF